jgi:hypothetical protein
MAIRVGISVDLELRIAHGVPTWAVVPGIALMALTRLYLGEHWLSDVVGGLALGLGVAERRAHAAGPCEFTKYTHDDRSRRIVSAGVGGGAPRTHPFGGLLNAAQPSFSQTGTRRSKSAPAPA